jgi:cytochrome c
MGITSHVVEAMNACAFSPCGTYLVCGTGRGRLHVWRFSTQDSDSGLAPPERCVTVRAHGCSIYALTFAQTAAGLLLLSGADEEICGWRWDAVLNATNGVAPAPVLRLENSRAEARRGALGQLSETSALAVDAAGARLYSAAGDGNAYTWDLETQACVGTFAGVGEPLHCLALAEGRQQLVTGGEDGGVRLWDVRASTCSQVLRPNEPPVTTAAMPVSGNGASVGSFCGCVAVDGGESWLVAGWGDGFLCSIDLNTLAAVACMPTAAAPLAACFEPSSDFHLVSVGADDGLYHWRLTGELETREQQHCPLTRIQRDCVHADSLIAR